MAKSDTITVPVSVLDEIVEQLNVIREGDYTRRVDAKAQAPKVKELVSSVNKVVEILEERAEQLHASSMELALGLSECFQALSEVRAGNLEARVGDTTTTADNELMAKFARSLNLTLHEIQQTIVRIEAQRFAIQSLSTPVLQIWDDVLALPIIGIVDSDRGGQIMERLLQEIVARQAKYVILDITGVEVVDTATADHFIKVVRAAELLGTRCIVTGIQPAVAQTLVDLGVDLSRIVTLRTLRDGLRECVRHQNGRNGGKAGKEISKRGEEAKSRGGEVNAGGE